MNLEEFKRKYMAEGFRKGYKRGMLLESASAPVSVLDKKIIHLGRTMGMKVIRSAKKLPAEMEVNRYAYMGHETDQRLAYRPKGVAARERGADFVQEDVWIGTGAEDYFFKLTNDIDETRILTVTAPDELSDELFDWANHFSREVQLVKQPDGRVLVAFEIMTGGRR